MSAINVTESVATKLRITGAESLDPISVFIEDLGGRSVPLPDDPGYITRAGKVTMECFGESWSAYWGGMGDRSTIDFFLGASVDYLVGCFARGSEIDRHVFDGAALEKTVRKRVIEWRLAKDLSRDEARELYEEADSLSNFGTAEALMYSQEAGDLLAYLFGTEWHHEVSGLAMVTHPKRLYLARIVDAVQQALRQCAGRAAA